MASTTELSILVRVKDEATAAFGKMQTNLKGLGAAMGAVGGAITGTLALTVKAAMDAEAATARAATSFQNYGMTAEEATDSIREASEIAVQKGFDDEAAAEALGKLTLQTGDYAASVDYLNLSMDLARAKNISLEDASKAVGMVTQGNSKVLKEYGIVLDETKKPYEQLEELQKRVGGQAEAFGNTFEGQTEILQTQIGNLQESIGSVLLPILNDIIKHLTPIIEGIMKWMEANPELAKTIVMVAAVLGPLLVVLPLLVAAIAALMSPITLVILGIGLLVAAGVALYTHWDEVKAKAAEIWKGIADTIEGIVNRIKSGIVATINFVIDKVNSAIGFFNSVISGMNKVPGVSVPSIPSIPRLAKGGIVSSPTLALIGEAGPEAVVPLSRGGGAGLGGLVINIGTFVGGNPEAAARELGNLIIKQFQLNARVG